MDVTSAHLDVVGPRPGSQNWNEDDGGEEVSKRGGDFGHPLGKGVPPPNHAYP